MPTIADVARLAEVSIKTVSRVLNNEAHVRPAVQERVRLATQQLSYQPSQAARRLAGRRSYLITHLYEVSDSSYIGGIQSGAIRRCRELGYHLVVETLEPHLTDITTAIDRLIASLSPDGVILTPPLSDNTTLLEALGRRGVRTVQVGPVDRGHGLQVFMHERLAASAMTRHLIQLGHTRLAIVRGHPEHRGAAARFDGFLDAMAEAGLNLRPHYVAQGYFDVQSGIDAGCGLLTLDPAPTAIFATNDEMAFGVMIAARNAGMNIPGELSVAGFDDTPMSRVVWPPLTTVRQPLHEIGARAIDMLVRETEAEMQQELPFALELRGSTAPPP